MAGEKIYAYVDFEDDYVQPLLLSALKARVPPEVLVLIKNLSELPCPSSQLLQWRQYESIDFDHLMRHTSTSLCNSYVIRKALIRKHYLSTTISHWLTKHPGGLLAAHVKPSVDFEVDYAEFLDDALVEAYELQESWARNEAKETNQEHEWWILKPGMSDRGQGIRLFNSEEELTSIFQEWDPPSDDEDDAEHSDEDQGNVGEDGKPEYPNNGIITSQLRHFVAQPYIHPPLLLRPPHPSADRKFHIRAYVLAVNAIQIYVYRPMLALFANRPYAEPSVFASPNNNLPSHLTNTCLQTGEREGSVHAFWSLPFDALSHASRPPDDDWRENAFTQICQISGEVFEAAARSMSVHFQPLPNAFEIFGLDFLVDAEGTTWLLEVNAFPDFAQTGDELQGLVAGLFEGVVDVAVGPFFRLSGDSSSAEMVKVLDIDLGRR